MARHLAARRRRVTARRKVAAIGLAVLGLAGLSMASAAQLTVKGSPLQAGVSAIAACQTSGSITVGFTTGYVAGGYQATAVKFSGVDATCGGKTLEVQLVNGTTPVGTVPSMTVPAVGGTFSTASFAGVPVTSITSVAVVIHS